MLLIIHLNQKIHCRFLNLTVRKYPTSMNNSEIYVLLPKPCSFMWNHLLGNCLRNGRDRRPKYPNSFYLNLHFLTIAIGRVEYNKHASAMEFMMAWMKSIATCDLIVYVLIAINWIALNVVVSRVVYIGIVKIFRFNRIWVFQAVYFDHFLHNFQAKDFVWKGNAWGATKSVIQNYSQMLKNRRWTFWFKCMCFHGDIWDFIAKW